MREILTVASLLLFTVSFAQAQTSMELREWIAGYLEDLPNFVCDYTEKTYGAGRWNYWSLKKEHSGKVRFIDGHDEYQVLSVDGQPAETPIWKVSNLHDPFAEIRYLLSPELNYRFTPREKGRFSFRSDWGMGFSKGFTEDGELKHITSYPTWGTIWVDFPSHAVQKIEEHVKIRKGQPFSHGERVTVTEFALTSIEGNPYRLPARKKHEKKDGFDHFRIVQTYDNCKRFGADTVIHYGDPADGPD